MTFRDVIEMADALYPNAFSESEKMNFANDLGALLNRNYIKNMKTYTSEGGEGFSLPGGVTNDLVYDIFFDDVKQSGTSVSSILAKSAGHSVKVKYLDVPHYTADSELPVAPPFHNLFLYYILAFILLHSGDEAGYNSNISIYHTYLLDYEKTFVQCDGEALKFKNLW